MTNDAHDESCIRKGTVVNSIYHVPLDESVAAALIRSTALDRASFLVIFLDIFAQLRLKQL